MLGQLNLFNIRPGSSLFQIRPVANIERLSLQQMTDQQFRALIVGKAYKHSQEFNSSPKQLQRLTLFMADLPVSKQSFEIVLGLVKYYKVPILMACRPLYEKVKANFAQSRELYKQELRLIAYYVKICSEGFKLLDLEFFYLWGIADNKSKKVELSLPARQFIVYIESLCTVLAQLRDHGNDYKVIQQSKDKYDQTVKKGIGRKFNYLEIHFQQHYIKEIQKIFRKWFKTSEPQQGQTAEENFPLCCRNYFMYEQVIKDAENLTLEYKRYQFPFSELNLKILKKTVCAFLNTQGGTIFIGIEENIDNKKRRVIGLYADYRDQQDIVDSIRYDVLGFISPPVVGAPEDSLVSVSFVPVYTESDWYRQIATAYFLVKVHVRYGKRDEIYSYKHGGSKDYFSFRTENEVIHLEGRDIVNAYRHRLKNPLPVPAPIHEGHCQLSDKLGLITAKPPQGIAY